MTFQNSMIFKNTNDLEGENIGYLPFPDALEMKYVFHPRGGTDTWNKSQNLGTFFGDLPK